MLRGSAYPWPVIDASQLREARIRAGYTSQKALADALGVSERTVTTWESEGGYVSTRAEARVRSLLWPAPAPLSHYSNFELLSEIGRRLEAVQHQQVEAAVEEAQATYGTGRRQGGGSPTSPA